MLKGRITMNKLIKLLDKSIEEHGYWELRFNPHHQDFQKDVKEYYYPNEGTYYIREKEIDWNKNIYELVWYGVTPVGNYDILANSIEDMIFNVKQVIKWNNPKGN